MNGVNYASSGGGILDTTGSLLVIANTHMPLNYEYIRIFQNISFRT
jgi:hypothetical protein